MQIIITVVAWSLCVRVYLCVSVAKMDETIKMLFVAWTRGSARNQSWVLRSPPGQGALGGGGTPRLPAVDILNLIRQEQQRCGLCCC